MNHLSPFSDDDLMALLLADETRPQQTIRAHVGQAPAPLSFAQQRLWFLQQFDPRSHAYNLPRAITLDGPLQAPVLENALAKVIDRHDILRTRFCEIDGVPAQVVEPAASLALTITDLSALPAEQQQREVGERLANDAAQPFDLAQAPLMRASLLKLADQRHVLLLNMHHIISDAWSNPILSHDLVQAYALAQQQPQQSLPRPAIQYADYARWQREDYPQTARHAEAMQYWKAYLGDEITPLALPHDRIVQPGQPGAAGRHPHTLPAALVAQVQSLCQQLGMTPFVLLLGAWQLLLARHSGQREFTVGVPNATRNQPQIQDLVGCFVSSQVYRVRLDPSLDGLTFLKDLRQQSVAALEHADYPIELVLEDLHLQRSAEANPLFQTLFNWRVESSETPTQPHGALRLSYLAGQPLQAKFDLSLDVEYAPSHITAHFEYDTARLLPETVATLATHWQNLLQALVNQPTARLGELPLLAVEQQRKQLHAWNGTSRDYPDAAPVHVLIGERARRTPDALAATCEGHSLTLGQLDRRANQLAHRLIELGVGPDVRVGLGLTRSLDLLVALLAVLKAGGAYVPLDPDYPAERLAYMMRDSAMALLLTQQHLALPVPEGLPVLVLDQASAALHAQPDSAPTGTVDAEHLAYLIYTSGSTGQPKGVAVRHGGLSNHMLWMREALALGSEDRVLQRTAFSFDASVWEFWLPLLSGAQLVLAPASLSDDLSQLWSLVEAERISVLQMAPSLLQALLPQAEPAQLASLRSLLLGGEALGSGLVQQLRARWQGRLCNLYGPTEATIDTTLFEVGQTCDSAVAAIGRPIANVRTHVLDHDLQPCPVGTPGELLIGGASLARGYHQRPGLTAERFVPDPFAANGERLYRSGDLVRYRADGVIDYSGRIDHQVKIRGLRIELGEIEAQLQQLPTVHDAVVVAQAGQLVAYLVAQQAPATDDAARTLREAIKADLAQHLPQHMVPAQLVLLERLPLTSNGKLDRKALPAVDAGQALQAYSAPQNPLQQRIAEIWQDVLKLERIGLHDNFFELGGDSIISIQVVSRARQQGIRFTPKDLFQHQTIQGLASVARTDGEGLRIDQGPVSGPAPLLPIQHAFFESAIPQRQHWNQSVLLKPSSPLQPALLEQALAVLISHHDALRLGFSEQADGWLAQHREAPQPVLWHRHLADTAQLPALVDQAQRSLDLAHGPLLRALLAELGDGSQRLLLVIHHLVVDGVSWRILFDDLQTVYRQLQQQQPAALPEKTSAYQAWGQRLGAYASSPALKAQLPYWQAQLQQDDGLLPYANLQGGQQHRHAVTLAVQLDRSQTQRLLQVAPGAYRTQINDLLLTALTRAVGQWTARQHVALQLEGHGREALFDDVDLTRTVGWFTSLFPLRLDIEPDLGAGIKRVKEQLRQIPEKGLGFGVLRYLSDSAPLLAEQAMPRITFNYLGQFDGSFDDAAAGLFAPAGEGSGEDKDGETPLGNWLTVNSQVYDNRLSMGWTFSRELFDPADIQALADSCQRELIAVIDHCCSGLHHGVTPSDFPLADLDQQQLDALDIAVPQIEDIYPLSPMQEGLLVHTLLEQHSGIYFMQECYTIREPLDYALFEAAWQQVVQRYEAIRASFLWNTGGRLLQVIHRHSGTQVEHLDLSQVPMAEVEARILQLLKEEREAGFDLAKRPPIRFKLILLADGSHRFIMSNHHILLDAWCRSLLMADFFEIYHALVAGSAVQLATPHRYRDFIHWLEGQDRDAARAFWRDQLAGLEQSPSLPVDRPQPLPGSVSVIADNYTWLTPEDTQLLQETASRHRLTLNTFVQAAWALSLHHHSRSRDIVFGVTVSGRPAHIPQMQNTVGLFINSVPLRIGLPDSGSDLTTLAWLESILQRNVALREYDYLPLVDIQECSDIVKGQALFNTLFVYENAPMEASVGSDARDMGVISESSRTHTNYPITAVIYPGEKVGLHLSYDTRYFDPATMDSLLDEFKQWLNALPRQLNQRLAGLSLLKDEDIGAWALEHNQTEVAHDLQRSFVEQFEAQVDAHPERIAASCAAQAWSYRQLDARANVLGQRLIELGVQMDQPVALLAERSLELLGMIVGAFKAGAGYLPLDPAHPAERLGRILTSSKTPLLVCTQRYQAMAQGLIDELAGNDAGPAIQLVVWQDLPEPTADTARPGRYSGPDNLAYVIFTSGSTGQPKGVMVQQAGMLNNQLSKVPYLGLDAHDIIAQTASQSFDISVWQFLTALLCGAKVCIFDDEIARHPQRLLEQVRVQGVTVLEIVPALIQALLLEPHDALAQLRWLLPTGEALPTETAAAWLARYPQIRLVNAYGPAECSDDVAFYDIDPASTQRTYIPIGYPTDNNRLYVLDMDLAPIPSGATGELCIAGVGVGRGYCADPVRTALSFVPNPYPRVPGERLYRSGDLGRRRREDGALEYIGRVDQQVKIHGFRIELGEIEAQIALFPGVREAAARVADNALGKQLLAYLTLDAEQAQQLTDERRRSLLDELRSFLKARLPAYMVPAQVHVLEQMPRNHNGKLDRKALDLLDVAASAQQYRAPAPGLEQDIAMIWQTLLRGEPVGLDDNFFALGGNSLLATQVTSRIQLHLGIEVPLAQMFESASLEDFVRRLAPTARPPRDNDLNELFDLLDSLETQ
ncbi:Linear gramicidin synthase subunit B [compost metagenome]